MGLQEEKYLAWRTNDIFPMIEMLVYSQIYHRKTIFQTRCAQQERGETSLTNLPLKRCGKLWDFSPKLSDLRQEVDGKSVATRPANHRIMIVGAVRLAAWLASIGWALGVRHELHTERINGVILTQKVESLAELKFDSGFRVIGEYLSQIDSKLWVNLTRN